VTGTVRAFGRIPVVIATVTGADSRPRPARGSTGVTWTTTVGGLAPGRTAATVPTDAMVPGVTRPLGSVMATRSPRRTSVRWLASRLMLTAGLVEVAVSTLAPGWPRLA
jgi:hypothetical protein